jgi:CelD/BcsL family acetyltransferase involved in cellulose biosynthesis
MPLYCLDPLIDRRWDELVETHPKSSVFHRKEWLKTLADTYGYKPLVVTSTAPGNPLSDGIAFCQVKSWITGHRLVSLPFSDHSEPLLSDSIRESELVDWLIAERQRRRLRYIEMRPIDWSTPGSDFGEGSAFWIHHLDLTKPIAVLFQNLHKNSLQRRIRKAERENLEYERGCSDKLLDEFCTLLLITRRRHHLLPQPRTWFRNLAGNMRHSLDFHIARKDGRAIAALVTLRHRRTVVYKYGCSDEQYHYLAGMPFLFWKLIEQSHAQHAVELDFGRTDLDNEGLIRFKDQFGTVRRKLTYLRYPKNTKEASAIPSQLPFAGQVFSMLPGAISWRLGGMLYRHMG